MAEILREAIESRMNMNIYWGVVAKESAAKSELSNRINAA